MKVAELMTRNVRMARPEEALQAVAKRMADDDIGLLPVEENDRLVGMITDRDIAIRGIAMGKGPDAKVRDVMSREVRYCFDDEDIDDVLHDMRDLKVRRMPVLNRDKRLVGIVSLGDLATNGESAETGEALSGISQPGGKHSQKMQ